MDYPLGQNKWRLSEVAVSGGSVQFSSVYCFTLRMYKKQENLNILKSWWRGSRREATRLIRNGLQAQLNYYNKNQWPSYSHQVRSTGIASQSRLDLHRPLDCSLEQQEGILHAHAWIRWTTIAWAHQIWWRESKTQAQSYSPFKSHFVGALNTVLSYKKYSPWQKSDVFYAGFHL